MKTYDSQQADINLDRIIDQEIDEKIFTMLTSSDIVSNKHQFSRLMDRHRTYAGTIFAEKMVLSPASLIRLSSNLEKLLNEKYAHSPVKKKNLKAVCDLAMKAAMKRATA